MIYALYLISQQPFEVDIFSFYRWGNGDVERVSNTVFVPLVNAELDFWQQCLTERLTNIIHIAQILTTVVLQTQEIEKTFKTGQKMLKIIMLLD